MRPSRETVTLARPVFAERIPAGTHVELPSGTRAQITQALGSSFTLLVDGQLMRLQGRDADAIGKPVPQTVAELVADTDPDDVRGRVWQVLKTCYDPEIPINIVDLGLVYVCDVLPLDDQHYRVSIKMTLTAPGCGMGDAIADEIQDKLLALPRVEQVDIEVVFDPPWDRSMMSDAAALALGL